MTKDFFFNVYKKIQSAEVNIGLYRDQQDLACTRQSQILIWRCEKCFYPNWTKHMNYIIIPVCQIYIKDSGRN